MVGWLIDKQQSDQEEGQQRREKRFGQRRREASSKYF
jgi:hypothetical protein